MNKIIKLDKGSIEQKLKSDLINVRVLDTVDSTNQFLKNLPTSDTIEVCCAETQTHGRGRFGRSWHSPKGENIYFSIRWHLDCHFSQWSGLSLVVSMTILSVLNKIDNTIRIKWPNDLLWQGKKLCGNLIEVVNRSDVVIGIGLNVNSSADKLWCSLYEITRQRFDRNELIAQLITQMDNDLKQFLTHGFGFFMPAWQGVDYLYGQLITVSQPTGFLSGKANGINEAGQLILIDNEGETHYLSSGDTSLRL